MRLSASARLWPAIVLGNHFPPLARGILLILVSTFTWSSVSKRTRKRRRSALPGGNAGTGGHFALCPHHSKLHTVPMSGISIMAFLYLSPHIGE